MSSMRSTLCLLGLLAAACPPVLDDDSTVTDDDMASDDDTAGDDDATGDDDIATDDDSVGDDDDVVGDFCSVGPSGEFSVCTFDGGFPWNQDLVARFLSFGDGEHWIELLNGDTWPLQITLSGEAADDVPDLMALDWVRLRLDGTCNRGGSQAVLSIAMADDADAIVFVGGNAPSWEGFGLVIESPRNIESCPAVEGDWCGCAESCHVKQVVFSAPGSGQAWGVLQGERLDDGVLRFAAWSAQSRVNLTCADVPEEVQSWAMWLELPATGD